MKRILSAKTHGFIILVQLYFGLVSSPRELTENEYCNERALFPEPIHSYSFSFLTRFLSAFFSSLLEAGRSVVQASRPICWRLRSAKDQQRRHMECFPGGCKDTCSIQPVGEAPFADAQDEFELLS